MNPQRQVLASWVAILVKGRQAAAWLAKSCGEAWELGSGKAPHGEHGVGDKKTSEPRRPDKGVAGRGSCQAKAGVWGGHWALWGPW